MGYTYDWGNPPCPFGLCEFILKIDPDHLQKLLGYPTVYFFVARWLMMLA